jgi:hypothetical protein
VHASEGGRDEVGALKWLLLAFIVSNVCGSAAAPGQEGEQCDLKCENLVLTRARRELSSNAECWLATVSCLIALSPPS